MIPRLSVIVCTFNRASALERCLEGLRAQHATPHEFEVLVIDNASTDDTRQRLGRYLDGPLPCRYVFEPVQGLSHARNRGAREAAAPYVTYLDDDAVAPPEFVGNLLAVIGTHNPDIVGGPIFPYYTSPKPPWFRDRYEIRQYATTSGFSNTCGVSGSNFTIRRALVEQLGGFDVNLGMRGAEQGFGEDRALLVRYRSVTPEAEQRVYYSLDCRVLHWVAPYKQTLRYLIRRHFEGGLMHVHVANRAATTQAAVTEFSRAPWATLRYLARQWRQSGILHTDYREMLLTAAFHGGIFVALLRQLPRRLRASRGPS